MTRIFIFFILLILGVTVPHHPIYSVSKGDWQHADHLEIGEEVLAKGGNTKVVSKERDQTLQPVYNLEVKDLHNFLVGDNSVVVHNACIVGGKKVCPPPKSKNLVSGSSITNWINIPRL